MAKQKSRNAIAEGWISYPRSMVTSPAHRALSLSAIKVMHRLEEEHMAHGGAENGRLQVTFDQFVEWGIDRKAIAPAVRELVALGFVEITERGCAGNENQRRAHRFRLTYVNMKNRQEPTHEWRRIEALDMARAIVAAAKREVVPRARDLGRRSWRARMKNKIPVPILEPTSVPKVELDAKIFSSEGGTTRASSESGTTIYNLGGHSDSVGPLASIAKRPWTPPRWIEIKPVIDEALSRAIDGPSTLGQPAPMDALAEIERLILSNTLLDDSAVREAVH